MNQQANYTNNAIKSENQGCLHTKRFRRRPYWFCVPSGTYNRLAPVTHTGCGTKLFSRLCQYMNPYQTLSWDTLEPVQSHIQGVAQSCSWFQSLPNSVCREVSTSPVTHTGCGTKLFILYSRSRSSGYLITWHKYLGDCPRDLPAFPTKNLIF